VGRVRSLPMSMAKRVYPTPVETTTPMAAKGSGAAPAPGLAAGAEGRGHGGKESVKSQVKFSARAP